VYDVSGVPSAQPVFFAAVPLSSISGSESPCTSWCQREGWVLDDLSGRYVYVADTGDVVETGTLKVIATLPALRNTRMLAEIDWNNGAPPGTSTRFGLGRVTN
jgi:YVTN family beta-propeller protein